MLRSGRCAAFTSRPETGPDRGGAFARRQTGGIAGCTERVFDERARQRAGADEPAELERGLEQRVVPAPLAGVEDGLDLAVQRYLDVPRRVRERTEAARRV